MLTHLLTLPCTIISRSPSGSTDDYGNDTQTETTTTTVCELQQQQRIEPAAEGELGVTTWLLILPAGTVIDTGDGVSANGHLYELVGPPWDARNPLTGEQHHIEATVARTGGSEETGS